MRMNFRRIAVATGALILSASATPSAAEGRAFTKTVFASPAVDLADFDRFATRAKQSGATHIMITAEDLPWSFWQYDNAGRSLPDLGHLKCRAAEDRAARSDSTARVRGLRGEDHGDS